MEIIPDSNFEYIGIINNYQFISSYSLLSKESRAVNYGGFTDSELLATLDSTFTYANTTKQFVVNAISVKL